jgi:FAD synthetase
MTADPNPRRAGRRVLASGVFDIIHPGHLHYLRHARALGDWLTVVVTSDAHATQSKRSPVHSQAERSELVGALRDVNEVIVGAEPYDLVETTRRAHPQVIALGYDQDFDEAELARTLAEAGIDVEVVRVPPYPRPLAQTRTLLSEL